MNRRAFAGERHQQRADVRFLHAGFRAAHSKNARLLELLSALSTFCGLENAPDALIIRNGLLGRDENGELFFSSSGRKPFFSCPISTNAAFIPGTMRSTRPSIAGSG